MFSSLKPSFLNLTGLQNLEQPQSLGSLKPSAGFWFRGLGFSGFWDCSAQQVDNTNPKNPEAPKTLKALATI